MNPSTQQDQIPQKLMHSSDFKTACSSSSSESINRLHCTARGIISLSPYIHFPTRNKGIRLKKKSGVRNTFLRLRRSKILLSLRSWKTRRRSRIHDWQCLASILTLSTNPRMRSSYWLGCPLIRSWPCLRTSSEETSISSSCSFSVLEIAYHSIPVSFL